MSRFNKIHPALKHAGYSATRLLPGEDAVAFEKLHQELIDEFSPVGALEEDIVADIARLTWRKQNLATFRIAEFARRRLNQIYHEKVPDPPSLLSWWMTSIQLSEKQETELLRNRCGKNSGTFIN
jgi:hypothetical protein